MAELAICIICRRSDGVRLGDMRCYWNDYHSVSQNGRDGPNEKDPLWRTVVV